MKLNFLHAVLVDIVQDVDVYLAYSFLFDAFSMAVVSTELKAFSKSMNAMYGRVLYSLHFSVIWFSVYGCDPLLVCRVESLLDLYPSALLFAG